MTPQEDARAFLANTWWEFINDASDGGDAAMTALVIDIFKDSLAPRSAGT